MIALKDFLSGSSHHNVDFNWATNSNVVKNLSVITVKLNDFKVLWGIAYEEHTKEIFVFSLAKDKWLDMIAVFATKTIIEWHRTVSCSSMESVGSSVQQELTVSLA
jgi:hypothetical protein